MSGDYSRDSFDALRDYAGVFLQQGRAVLDSDWNEMVDLFERRIRAGTVDTIGRAVVPRETPHGFEIRPSDTGLEIGRGRFYQYGKLLECHGSANFTGGDTSLPNSVFDRARPGSGGPEGVLDEMIAPPAEDFVDYFDQPYWPTPEELPEEGVHLVYLVGWQREITPTEYPGLLEPALGGIDTTTRWQSVWQVRVLQNIGDTVTCATADEQLTGWIDEIAPSTARLTTATIDIEDPEDPCLVPPTEGYSGIENQFYRVEIHSVGELDDNGTPPSQGEARFKFSRENASVRASVVSIADDAGSVTVSRIGRDLLLRFRPGDWAEVTDDHRELNHRSGQMLRVADVDPETRQITFESAIEADLLPSGMSGDTVATRHTRLVRWDQQGVIRLEDGSVWEDLDADGSDGLIPVPPDDRAVVLESGITVSFSTALGPGGYRAKDHWRFAARTAGTQVEHLQEAPPTGIQRHYSRLAIVRNLAATGSATVLDCRVFWPALFEATEGYACCACTVCVTAEAHNSGELTIQNAIDEISSAGGTICLEAGSYRLSEPLRLSNRNAIRIVGQGLGTLLLYQGAGGSLRVETCTDIELTGFTLLAAPATDDNGTSLPVHGVTAVNTSLLAIRRLAVLVASPVPEERFDFGIALDGVQLATKIEECVSIAPHALGSRSSYALDEDGDLQFVAFAELRTLDCVFFGGRDAVRIDRMAMNIAAARLSRNLIFSTGVGLRINWAELPAASLSIDDSTVMASGTAINISAGTTRIQDCEISGGDAVNDGIFLAPNILPETLTDAHIIGNTIFECGVGIRIAGAHNTLFIKRNIIRDSAEAGIATSPDATIRHLAIDNNAIERIGIDTGLNAATGIVLTSVESGQVIGNSIHGVGGAGFSGQHYVGIGVQGVGSVDISSNIVSDIGDNLPKSSSVGILARQPFLSLNIGSNRIIGDLQQGQGEERVAWRAIQIGVPIEDFGDGDLGTSAIGFTAAVPIFEATELIYFNTAEETWSVSSGHLAAVFPTSPSQITCIGNHARSSQNLLSAMVTIVEPGATGLSFANNICHLQSETDLRELVLLGAPRVSASSNTLTHFNGEISLHIITGRKGAATPIGNITSAAIIVRPGGLPAPFSALNLNA